MSITNITWAINQQQDKIIIQLIGELQRDTLLPLWQQRSSFVVPEKISQTNLSFDLQQVKRIDSAGLALLCSLINIYANAQSIQVINAQDQLLKLVDLYSLRDWFANYLA